MLDSLKYIAKMFVAGVVMLGASLFSNPSTAQTININGTVTSAQTGAPIAGAKEVLINPATGTRLDSTSTNTLGKYGLIYVWDGLQENNTIIKDILFPNPYNSQTKVNTYLSKDALYQIKAIDLNERLLFADNLSLSKGAYELQITGGQAGVNIITIINGTETQAYKGIQTTSTGQPININVHEITTTPPIKSTLDEILAVGDLAKIESSKPGYYTKDTTFMLQENQTINLNLQKIPVTYDFLVNAYTVVDGSKVIDGTSLKVTWGDGTTNTYSSTNGLIQILRENTYDTISNIFFENADTSFYQEWIFGVKTDNLITTKEKNLFQNTKEHSGPPGSSYIYPGSAPANLKNLPTIFDVYFVPVWVQDSEGNNCNTRGEVFRTVAQCRGVPSYTKKWETIPEVADTLLFYDMQILNYNVNQQITYEQSQAQKIAMDSVETQLFYLQANGRQLVPVYKRANISTMTEPEWLAGQAREFDQTHVNQFGNENANGCVFTQNYAWGDWYRFKGADAKYVDISNITYKIAEMTESFTHCRDPLVGNLGGYIVNATGIMTTFGKALHIIFIAEPKTDFW